MKISKEQYSKLQQSHDDEGLFRFWCSFIGCIFLGFAFKSVSLTIAAILLSRAFAATQRTSIVVIEVEDD